MKKIIFAVLALVVIAGGCGAAYWFGNRPKVTYYPNGQIETSVEQKFFKEEGAWKMFNSDGTLSQEYVVTEGVRNGKGTVYAGEYTVDVNYANGSLNGPLQVSAKQEAQELKKWQINMSNSGFVAEYNDGDSADISVKTIGKLLCDDKTFLNNMQAFLLKHDLDTFKNLAKCVSVTENSAEIDELKCTFNGAYTYPNFTADSQIKCENKQVNTLIKDSLAGLDNTIGVKEMLSESDSEGDGEQKIPNVDDINKITMTLSYSKKDEKFTFNVVDDKGFYNNTQTFKGLDGIIAAAGEYAFSKQENKDMVKLVSEIFKKLEVTDSQLYVNGKIVSAVKGSFNFINGFSNPWTASFYAGEDTMLSQLKVNDKGVVVNLAYPISQKPLFSFGIQVNDKFKEKYKSFLELVMKEFSEKSEDEAAASIMAKLPEYSMAFSDVINSVNALLMNNQGEKVVGAVFNVKKGIDFMTAMSDINNAFTVKVISYKDNKPYKVASGDLENGLVVDGKVISFDNNLEEFLGKDNLEKVIEQIESEFKQLNEKLEKEQYYGNPFLLGFFSGYGNAMDKYNTNKTLDQLAVMYTNIRTLFVDEEGYGRLNNALAINLGVVPEDIIAENKSLTNVFGGKVNITSAQAFAGDDKNSAFMLTFDNVPQEACKKIALSFMSDYDVSGLVGMGINENISDLYLDDIENIKSEKCARDGVYCAIEDEALMTDIVYTTMDNFCKKDGNTLYFKFE